MKNRYDKPRKTLTLELTADEFAFVEGEARALGFPNVERYLLALIRWDVRHRGGVGSWQNQLPLENERAGDSATIQA